MVSSTIRSIALVVFILAPISVFSQTFPSLAAAADKRLLKPAELDQIVAGLLAQEVQQVVPHAVARGTDGYLRVFYEKLGLKFETYDHWINSGALPATARIHLHKERRQD